MANNSHDDIELHPSFFKPPNVVNLREKSAEDGSVYYNDRPPVLPSDNPEEDDQPSRPMPPTSFSVVSQQVRTTPDGKQVVDLILELPDQEGVKEYDIRVAKYE